MFCQILVSSSVYIFQLSNQVVFHTGFFITSDFFPTLMFLVLKLFICRHGVMREFMNLTLS